MSEEKNKIQINNIYSIIEHDVHATYFPKKKKDLNGSFSNKAE